MKTTRRLFTLPKITITIEIDDGEITVNAPAEIDKKSDLEPFLMHTDEELEIPDRPVTTDEDPADILRANHERYVKQVADDMIDPTIGATITGTLERIK